MVYLHRYTCAPPLALIFWLSTCLSAATTHVESGPLNINGQNGTVYENLHITSTNGTCVTINNSTNITLHNSEIGPCGGQGVSISGGSGIKILDSYIHPESTPQPQSDSATSILVQNTSGLLVQGNVVAYGANNMTLFASDGSVVRGNFFLNARNPGYRGVEVQVYGSTNTMVDNNYVLSTKDATLNGVPVKYPGVPEDRLNTGGGAGWPDANNTTFSNNYVEGGFSASGCGIIADSRGNGMKVLNNRLVNTGQCGIAVTDGVNQVIDGNKVFITNPISGGGNTAIATVKIYSTDPPCGPTQITNNIAVITRTDGMIGWYDGGGCGPITQSGNTFGDAAYAVLNPPSITMKPPMIPPQPSSCAVVSPFTNQSVASCSGATAPPPPPPPPAPTVSLVQPASNSTLSGMQPLSATVSSGVTSVSFVRDGNTPLGQAMSSPWAISVDTTTIPNGSHTLAAIATQSGTQTTSALVPVTIQNSAVLPPPCNSISSLWTLVNPAGGSACTNGSQLLLSVPGGSNHDPAFGGANNSVRLQQQTGNTDFAIEVKFDSIPTQQYQFEGILVNQDSSSYLRFQFGSTGSVLVVNSDVVSANVSTGPISATISPTTGSLWMRVQRTGSTWTQSWSPDGKTYSTVGSFTQPLTVSSMGPFAGNYSNTASSAPAFTSAIDYFTNMAPTSSMPVVSDNFTLSPVPATGGLNTNIWKLVNPAGGGYTMNGTELLLTAPAGSNHDPSLNKTNNSVRVIQTTGNADFTIETKFDSIPNAGYQFEGILVGQDAANYLRFQFGSTGSLLVVGASTITSGVENSVFSPVISLRLGTKSLWMRVSKSGSTWTETWSTDGTNFTTVGTFTQPLTVTSVGPFVGNYNNTASAVPAFTSAIDYFTNITTASPGAPGSDNFNQ